MRHTGNKRREGADKRHEARQNHGDAAVTLVKSMGLVKGFAVEPARVLPLEHLGPQVVADLVIALVTQKRRGKQDRRGQRIAHQAGAAHGAHDEQQRIAGQKRHHHHAGLDKDNQKQQRIHPHAVGGYKSFQVFVDMQNEVDQMHACIDEPAEKFQNTTLYATPAAACNAGLVV